VRSRERCTGQPSGGGTSETSTDVYPCDYTCAPVLPLTNLSSHCVCTHAPRPLLLGPVTGAPHLDNINIKKHHADGAASDPDDDPTVTNVTAVFRTSSWR